MRLAHPALLDAAGLQRLRSLAAGLRIEPPVRQLWRETFRVSAAERESGAESARYAGHVLRFKQCYGLARSRGWDRLGCHRRQRPGLDRALQRATAA